jgi:hypothetical protein
MYQVGLTSIATWVLAIIAFASFWLQLHFSRKQLREARDSFEKTLTVQRELSRNEVGIRLYLVMTERFDHPRMDDARKRLAQHFIREIPDKDMDETVLNFFEDLRALLRAGHLNEELAYHAFSYAAEGWWTACSEYVMRERASSTTLDATVFSEFEFFAERMFQLDILKRNISRAEVMGLQKLGKFLREEAEMP